MSCCILDLFCFKECIALTSPLFPFLLLLCIPIQLIYMPVSLISPISLVCYDDPRIRIRCSVLVTSLYSWLVGTLLLSLCIVRWYNSTIDMSTYVSVVTPLCMCNKSSTVHKVAFHSIFYNFSVPCIGFILQCYRNKCFFLRDPCLSPKTLVWSCFHISLYCIVLVSFIIYSDLIY